jgi:hypothetical protein
MKATLRLLAPLALLFFFNPSRSHAQIDLGVKGGLSIPNLTSGSSDNPINSGYSSRLGPDFAIHAEFHLSKHFSIQPQLEYSSQGGKKNGDQAFSVPPGPILYATYNSTAKINYLMLPILAKYRFLLSDHWNLYVAAGPFVSFVVSAKNITSGTSMVYLDAAHTQPTGQQQNFDADTDIKSDLHKANAGVNGHLGLAYQFGRNSVFLEAGGNYGFVNIQKNEVNGKNNTGAAVVVVGYAFRICNAK